ncbi:unnamed protein product, partial [Sphacelaria rigidula]
MKDTVDSIKANCSRERTPNFNQIAIDLDLEATDPLAKHEVTLQFAAFRAPAVGERSTAGGSGRGADVCSGRGAAGVVPTSVYFTYQFYTCQPTRTERMLL